MSQSYIITKYFKYSIWGMIIVLLPILLIDDNLISSNDILVKFSNLFSNIFPNIENHALKSQMYGLYNKMKLMLTLNIFIIIFTFLSFFPLVGKVYLCSIGVISCSKNFISKNIIEGNNNFKDTFFIILFSVFLFYIIKDYYMGNLNLTNKSTFISFLYGNSIALIAYAIVGYLFIISFVISIWDTLILLFLKVINVNKRKK